MASALQANENTAGIAEEFLRSYSQLRKHDGLTGIPNESQLVSLSNYFTPELQRLFFAALQEQRRCEKKFPEDKPPWIEGDIFSSSFEGFTSFHFGSIKQKGHIATVVVKYTDTDKSGTTQWTDALILKALNGQWLIDDMQYRGKIAFGNGFGARLSSSLKHIPAC